MKKFLLLGIILFLFFVSPVAIADEAVYLAIQEVEPTFSEKVKTDLTTEDETLKSENEEKYSEGENFIQEEIVTQKKAEKPLEAEVEYDILYERTPILSEYTSMEFECGPIEKFNPFFAYQGQFRFDFLNTKYNTKYLNPTSELALNGKFRNQPIYFTFILNLMSEDGYNYFQTMFKDDFITLKYIPHNDIVIGSFRTPIGVEGGTSGYTLPFIARSQIARNFGSVRGLGAKVMGNYSLVEYNLGATSSDRMYTKFVPGAEFNGWVNFKPLGKTDGRYGVLKVGGGLNAGHRDFDYNVAGVFVSYKFRKIALESEYAISNGSNGLAGLTKNKAQGVYTTLSYNITKKLQLLARYDLFDANRETSGNKSSEYTAGLNYFIKGSALKLILNYTFRHSEHEANSNRIMLGTQIML